MRVATIDIGTNTVLLLVADVSSDGTAEQAVAVEERATITRLGQGVDQTRQLAPDAVERTVACLTEYAAAARAAGAAHVEVVGTSAMRDAAGNAQLRAQIRDLFGVEARVLSGEEEARLTFRGALSGLAVVAPEVTVFDIGGGSTELVRARVAGAGAPAVARSVDLGSVRLTERHLRHDPPSPDERAALEADVARVLDAAAVDWRALADHEPLGIAGTVTTLAAVALGLEPYDGARVHGLTLPIDDVRRVVDELAVLPVEARRHVRGMEPKRADVIVAGGWLVLALLDRLGAHRLRVSDRGVRWGLALDLLGDLARRRSPATV